MKFFWEIKNFHHNDRQCPFKGIQVSDDNVHYDYLFVIPIRRG
jgi:hypothetical protein